MPLIRWLALAAFLLVPTAGHSQTLSCSTVTHFPVSLRIASVTTGGTAVAALNAGDAVCGGFIVTANAAGMCVNQNGAAGTASSGDTVCVAQNVIFPLFPSSGAVSVNSSASTVALAGYGLR
jgi:cyanophycinase-like exopeptidase